jgi:hypothetical protein
VLAGEHEGGGGIFGYLCAVNRINLLLVNKEFHAEALKFKWPCVLHNYDCCDNRHFCDNHTDACFACDKIMEECDACCQKFEGKTLCQECFDGVEEPLRRFGSLPTWGFDDPERCSRVYSPEIFASYFRDNFLNDEYPLRLLWSDEDCEEMELYYIENKSACMSSIRWRCCAYKNKWYQIDYNSSSFFAAFMCELMENEGEGEDEGDEDERELLTCDGCNARECKPPFASRNPDDFLICDSCGLFLCSDHEHLCRCG